MTTTRPWLLALIEAHGEPVARIDEATRLGNVMRRVWSYVGKGVHLDYEGRQYRASAWVKGRKATLVTPTEPTDDEMTLLLQLAGLIGAEAAA